MLACSMPDLVAQVTSSLLQFPDVSVQALGEDEIRLDLVLRGKFAQGQNGWAWLACGPQLEVVNSVTGERLSAYRFSGIEQPPTVLAVKEFCWLKRTGLLVGLEETEGSVLCLYDLGLSRVVKAVVLPGRVTAIEPIINHGGANASTQHLHQSLRWFFGVAAVVTDLGHVFLIDICLDDLSCSQSELEASDLEIINRFPADVPQIRETVTRDGRHLCYQLHSATGTSATTLHYISRTNQLAVGFADGYLSLWNLKTLKKEYHCQLEGGRVPIYAVIFQEPENDPRSCCYLWAVQSAQDFEADVLSLHLLQLAFGDRKCISSGQILYEGLEYCEERYSQDLSRGIVSFRGQASNIKLLGCQTIEKFRGHSDREESMNEAMSPDTSIAVFSWQVNPYGQGKPSSYLGVFDINRWYHAQMPDSLRPGEFLHNCPYFSLWSLDSVVGMISPYYLLDILVHEKSLSRGVPPSYPPPEQFFSPSSYNFDATCLLNFGIVHLTCSGFQKETLQFLKKSGTCLDDAIPNGYNRCLVAGLLSPRLTDIQPSCLTEEEQLEALMTAAVETSSLGLLSGCIRQWSAEGAAAHLRFVLEWAWKKVVGTKEELDRICTPLFDGSCNFIDIQTFQSLQRCQLLLCNLSTIFSCFLTEAHDVTEKGLVELTNKCVVTTLLSQYAQVVLWFCRSGLLPDGSDEDEVLQLSRPFYNYQLIQSYYTSRRQKLERLSRGKWCGDCLMVDGMISQFGERIEKLWRRDDGGTGRYPPSTLHALLDIYLQENVQEMQKHAVIIYLLLDVMYSFPNKNKSSIEAFPTAFAIPLGLVKLIQGFWLLDHGDHENSLDLILHPATSRLLSSMEHKRIIHALMCQGEHKQALRYVQTMKPLMNTISEVKLYLSVLLLNRCMVEARDLVRQHASRLNMEDLLKHMYETCQEMSLMEDLLKLPFTAAEQDCLERFLYNSGGMQSHEFLLVHHLQRANYVPALQLNQSLNMNLMNDRVPRMRERATARNSILDQYGRVLPRVQRRLATERVKPYYHPSTVLREVSRPVPLSTVAKPVVSGKILTKATFINNLLSKIGEVWPRSQRNVNLSPYNSSDIEDESPSASPVELPDAFVGTPVTTSFKRMSRLFESVVCPVPLSPPIDSIQQMQSKTSPVWMTFSPARRSSAVSSQLKRISKASELSLLKTPPVVKKAKALASTTSGFSGFAPQSILRSSLRPSPLASPSASPGRSVTPPLRIKETRISFMEENIASTWNRNTADKESNLLPRSLSTSPWAARLEKVISFDLHKRFETEVPERTSSNEKYIAAEADISKEISSTSVRSEQSTLEYHDAQAPDDFYEESATLNSRPVENVNAEPIKNGEHEIFRSTALECFELVASTGKHSEPKSVARPAGLNGLSETAEEEPTDSMNEENVQCIDRLDRINSVDTELVNGPAETAKNTFAEVPEHEIIEQITQPVPGQVFDHRHLKTVNNESTTIGGSEHSAGAAETVCSSIEHKEEPAIEMSHNQQLDSSNRETSVEHEELNETESCAFPENGISSFAFSHPMHEAFTSQYTTREIENLTSNYETEGALLVSDECNTLIKITESASAVSENESVTVHDNEGVFASTYIENSLESGSAFLKTYDIEAKVVEENECQQDEHFIILPVKALEIHMVEDGELEEQTTEDSGEVSYVECHPPQPFQVSCTLDAEFMSNKINDNDMSTTEAAKCVSMNGNHDGPEENFTLILEGEDECSDTETTSTFHITTTVEVVDQEYEDQTSLQKSPTLVLVQEPNNADAPTYVPESVKEAVAESLSDAVKDTRNKDFVEMVETLDEEKTETDKALGRYLCQSLQPVVQDVKDPEVNDQVEVKETSNESDRGRSVLTKDETSFEILQSESEQNEQEVATLYPGSVEKLKEHFEIPETMHPDLTEGQIAGVSPAERLLPSPRRSTRKVQERLRSLEGVHPVSGEGSIAPVCPVVRSSPSPRRSTRKIQQRYGNNEMHPESGEEQIAQASPAVKFSQSPRNSTRRVQQRFESPEIVHPESGKEQIAGVSPALRSSTPSSSNQKAEQRFESPEVENLESEEEHITGVPLALRFSLSPTMSTKKAEQRFESPETEHPYSGEGQVDGVSTTLSSQSPKRSAKKEQTFESHEEELPVSGEDQIDGVSVALRSSQSPGRSTEKAEQRFESPETEHADAGEGQTAGVFPVLRALQSPRMSTEKEPRFGSPEAVFPPGPGGQTAKVSPTLRSSTSPRKSTRKVQQRFESPKAMHPDSAEEKIAEVSPALRSSPSPRRSTKKVEERFGSQKAVHSNLGDEQSSEESPNLTASPSLERSAGKLGARLPSPEAIQPESNERLIAQLFPTLRASASPRRSARRVRETFDTPEAVRPESPEGQSAQVSALRRSTRKKNTNVEMSGKAHPLADKRAQTPASVGRVTRSKKDAPLAIPEIWQTEVEDKHFKKTDQSLVSSSEVLKVTKGSSDVLQADLLSPKMTEISASPVRSSRKAKGITFSLPENVIDTQEKKTEQTSPKSFTKRAGRSRVLQSKEVTVPVSAETFDQLEHALLPFTPVSARKGTSYLQENIKNIGNVQDTIPLQEKLPVSLRRSARKATTSELKHTEASSALGKISVEPSTESILSKSAGKTAQTTKYHSVKEQLPAVEDISDEVFLQSESIDKNRLGGTNTNAPVIASRIEESISVKTTRATRSRAARDLSPEAAVKESDAPVFTRIARNSRVIEEPEHPVSSDVPQSLVSPKSVSSTPATRSKKKTKSVEEMGLPVIEDEVPKVTDIDETQTRAKSKAVKAAVKKRKRLKGGLWSPPPVEVNLISPLPSPLEEYMSNRKGADEATTKMILRTNRKRLMSAFPKPVTRRKML
ncbi:protein ELYS [Protopterus annectens]|uniref:protein ELYS n=1 Tax=Protopterus annectens TaxID=7888 RepID=UPI001CF9855E|nr:protein ELYS [Protopterus annectens]